MGEEVYGECYSGGKLLFVYPFTFYHLFQLFIYSSNKFCTTRKATKNRTLVAKVFAQGLQETTN